MTLKRSPGRPLKSRDEKSVRINITLSPAAIAVLDASEEPRSTLIERLIMAHAPA
jgi:hypothetical protein